MVDRVEGEPDINPVEESEPGVKRVRYAKLVEDLVSEKVAGDGGLDTEKSARVGVGKDADGDPELHVFRRSLETVGVVADGRRTPRVSIRYRYAGHRESPDEETGLMVVSFRSLSD